MHSTPGETFSCKTRRRALEGGIGARHKLRLPAASSRDWWSPGKRAGQREIRMERRAQGRSRMDAGVPARRRREMATATSGTRTRAGWVPRSGDLWGDRSESGPGSASCLGDPGIARGRGAGGCWEYGSRRLLPPHCFLLSTQISRPGLRPGSGALLSPAHFSLVSFSFLRKMGTMTHLRLQEKASEE